jgi:hypothetical protein
MSTPHIATLISLLLLAGNAAGQSTAQSDSAAPAQPGVVERVEQAVVRGAKAAASGVERGVKAATKGIERGAKAAASGVERGVKAAADGVQRGAQATGNAAGSVAAKVGAPAAAASQPGK